MFKRPTLYMDIYAEPSDYAPILQYLETYIEQCEPITRILKKWNFPEFVYDVLIVDAAHLKSGEVSLDQLYRHYVEVIPINIENDPVSMDIFFQEGVNLWLKKGYHAIESKVLIEHFFSRKLLQLENNLLYSIIHNARNSIVITDKKGNIEYANKYFEEISGFTTEEFISKSPNVIRSDFHDDSFYDVLWATIKSGKVWEDIFVNKDKAGNRFYEESTITPLLDSHGDIKNYLKIGKNITRERLLLNELSKEVKIAKKVIETLLPDPYGDMNIIFDYNLIHYNEIGGDFIYFRKSSNNKYHFALLDVMGHGVSSALIAVTMAQMFDDYLKFNPIKEAVDALNTNLCAQNSEDPEQSKYVTGLFMEMDFENDELKIINAGHMDVVLMTRNGQIIRKPSNNLIIGVMEQSHNIHLLKLSDYKKLMCYTDGLYEIAGMEYEKALTQIIRTFEESPEDKLFGYLFKQFGVDQNLKDDVTVCQIVFNDFPANLSKS